MTGAVSIAGNEEEVGNVAAEVSGEGEESMTKSKRSPKEIQKSKPMSENE